VVVPTAVEFYIPRKYSSLTNSQKNNIQYIYDNMSMVNTVDAYSYLEEKQDEYIYFRTDHHWTALGAYYAYSAFCEQAGIHARSLASFEKRSIKDYRGTVYSGTGDAVLWNNPDTVDYYMTDSSLMCNVILKNTNYWSKLPAWSEGSSGSYAYGVFIWGDNPVYHVNTTVDNGENVLLIKESFGNAFAPFLFANYDNVHVIDYRHYSGSIYDYVISNNIQTVIFLNNAFSANTSYHAETINQRCNLQ